MTRAYYNEVEPFLAAWCRKLIDARIIAPGDVDERSIVDVKPSDIKGYTQCHFFAGLGGWSYALKIAGWPDHRPVWTGSCPCQPFSLAGKKRGFADDRDLWPVWHQLIRVGRPPVLFGEQVAAATVWLDRLYFDLEAAGFAVGSANLPAGSLGALHNRPRLYFVADSQRNEQPRQEPRCGPPGRMGWIKQSVPRDATWQSALSILRVMGDGLPRSVGATDAARNAIVPQVAAQFIIAASEAINDGR